MWPNSIKLKQTHHWAPTHSEFKYMTDKSLAALHILLFEIVLFSTDHNITILSSLRYWSFSYDCILNIREHPNLYCSELTHVLRVSKIYFAQFYATFLTFAII
jgi:hypothetical protein